jgi:hypothetical protein
MESETLLTRFMEATLTEKLHRETVDHPPWMNVPSPLSDALIHWKQLD